MSYSHIYNKEGAEIYVGSLFLCFRKLSAYLPLEQANLPLF